ncbi:hypothetical protein EDD86DRAFT_214516 [Gorgonomyces haynaldii]|nr:hypothetical protein EDD86DRAFT_214516 [Gorgonomyces haynaldii]
MTEIALRVLQSTIIVSLLLCLWRVHSGFIYTRKLRHLTLFVLYYTLIVFAVDIYMQQLSFFHESFYLAQSINFLLYTGVLLFLYAELEFLKHIYPITGISSRTIKYWQHIVCLIELIFMLGYLYFCIYGILRKSSDQELFQKSRFLYLCFAVINVICLCAEFLQAVWVNHRIRIYSRTKLVKFVEEGRTQLVTQIRSNLKKMFRANVCLLVMDTITALGVLGFAIYKRYYGTPASGTEIWHIYDMTTVWIFLHPIADAVLFRTVTELALPSSQDDSTIQESTTIQDSSIPTVPQNTLTFDAHSSIDPDLLFKKLQLAAQDDEDTLDNGSTHL